MVGVLQKVLTPGTNQSPHCQWWYK